jgi:serine/threonine-protein kinase HipA
LFAWLIADGDMHLKNLALLKIAAPGSRRFQSVRFAPLYDAVTTRVFPGLNGDRMALKLNGKDDRLNKQDFVTLARTIGLPAARAEASINEVTSRLLEIAPELALPAFTRRTEAAEAAGRNIIKIVIDRCRALIRSAESM